MKQTLFSIYDEKAQAYLPPFFLNTVGEATRAISDCVNDPGHLFCRHTADYTLYQLAEFENSDGTFTFDKKLISTLLEIKAATGSDLSITEPQLSIVE